MLVVEVISFAVSLWLGLYLLQRYRLNPTYPALVWAAGGLISYSIALIINSVGRYAPTPLGNLLQQQIVFLILPMIFWSGALWHLRKPIQNTIQTWKSGENSAGAVGLVLIATIFFALGIGLILAPFKLIPDNWLFIAICGDLLLLGYAIGVLDAFELGESLLPDFIRSAIEAEAIASFFALQIGLVIWFVTGVTFSLVLLLFGMVASSIILTAFSRQIQAGFDQIVFSRFPGLSEERLLLREISDSLPKSNSPTPSNMLSADNFVKHTRTALSHMGNLPKLAANPLINISVIEKRLSEKGSETHTLMRAAELKQLLSESIERLKPEPVNGSFKHTKGWRHYNSLYFPYVKGLRPYGRRSDINGLSQLETDALAWFDREVPPRTLYNWQSAAAKIIANDLQEQCETLDSK